MKLKECSNTQNNHFCLMKFAIYLLIIFFIFNCSEQNKPEKPVLNQFELENGIGPIKEKIVLNEIDKLAVEQGKKIYQTKCISCHRLDTKLIGPPLRDVVQNRSPEFILNIIVNPVDMTLYHPEAKKMATEYGSQMTFQNIKLNDAYKILDYLRYENSGNK